MKCVFKLPKDANKRNYYLSLNRKLYCSSTNIYHENRSDSFLQFHFGWYKLQLHQSLIYDTVKINSGHGYHQDDGIFIAPRSGFYGFAWSLAVSSFGWSSMEIVINDQKYGRASADGDDGSHGYGTGFVIFNVKARDHVYIRMSITGDPLLYGDSRT